MQGGSASYARGSRGQLRPSPSRRCTGRGDVVQWQLFSVPGLAEQADILPGELEKDHQVGR